MKRLIVVCAAAMACALPVHAQTAVSVSDDPSCAAIKALVTFNYAPAVKLTPNTEILPAPASGILGKCFVFAGRAGSFSGICSASDALIAGNGTSSEDRVEAFRTQAMALAQKCLGRKADIEKHSGSTWNYSDASVYVGYGYGDPRIAGAIGNRIQFNAPVPGLSKRN